MKIKLLALSLCTLSLNATDFTTDMLDIKQESGYSVYKKGTNTPVTGLFKTYFDDNKTLKEIIPLNNGRINGTYQSFYKTGSLEQTIDYLDSKRTGLQTTYFNAGNKAYEITMLNEKKEGHAKEWYQNSQLKYDVLFHKDILEGLVTVYTKDGSIESIEKYKNGKIIKQIKPKSPNNMQLQTRALVTYGTGKDIYYLFISPLCPHCKDFLSKLKKYKDDATFYIYLIALNPKNKEERLLLDIVYREKLANKRLEKLFAIKNGSLDTNITISSQDTYFNNSEILKAQQIQAMMGVRGVPALIDTKGFKYNTNEFMKKYSKEK